MKSGCVFHLFCVNFSKFMIIFINGYFLDGVSAKNSNSFYRFHVDKLRGILYNM